MDTKRPLLALGLVGLVAGMAWVYRSSHSPDVAPMTSVTIAQQTPVRQLPQKLQRKLKHQRRPAAKREVNLREVARVVPDVKINFLGEDQLVTNIGAIPEKDYHPGLGELLSVRRGFAFYLKDPAVASLPVVINKYTGIVEPISTVVHLRGASPELRRALKKDGFKEFYYADDIKLLSLKTEPDKVLSTFHELRSRGLQAELEVIREKVVAK
jgi:hypothetical protein